MRTNLSHRRYGRVKVVGDVALLDGFIIDLDLVGLSRRIKDEGVESGRLCDLRRRSVLEVLLFDFASQGGLVSKDEVDLIRGAASIRTEHDAVGSCAPFQQFA